MTRLSQQLARLYLVPNPTTTDERDRSGEHGSVRAIVIAVRGATAWADLSPTWYGVQTDLALPAPAIAVSGTDAIQLWFSVEAPVPRAEACEFLLAIKRKYLGSIDDRRLIQYPEPHTGESRGLVLANLPPSRQEANGNWSAFVSQDLVAVFGDEPWLDVPPNPDQQADMLAKVSPMKAADFQIAIAHLRARNPKTPPITVTNFRITADEHQNLRKQEPMEFLLGVMNDPEIPLKHRIKAAKALLVHSAKPA